MAPLKLEVQIGVQRVQNALVVCTLEIQSAILRVQVGIFSFCGWTYCTLMVKGAKGYTLEIQGAIVRVQVGILSFVDESFAP